MVEIPKLSSSTTAGAAARGEAPLPTIFTTACADRQNRAGVGLRVAIGVGPDPRDTGAFPTLSFISEGVPAARPSPVKGLRVTGDSARASQASGAIRSHDLWLRRTAPQR